MLHLLQQGAIGAISTHDLALANVAPLDAAGHAVHFQESFTDTTAGRRMTFDYKLRPGIATPTNAVSLLGMVRLDAPEGAENSTAGSSASHARDRQDG